MATAAAVLRGVPAIHGTSRVGAILEIGRVTAAIHVTSRMAIHGTNHVAAIL